MVYLKAGIIELGIFILHHNVAYTVISEVRRSLNHIIKTSLYDYYNMVMFHRSLPKQLMMRNRSNTKTVYAPPTKNDFFIQILKSQNIVFTNIINFLIH